MLAGLAAARIGVGLVSMATPISVKQQVVSQFPEAIWPPLAASEDWISKDDVSQIAEATQSADSILLGPGFGQHTSTKQFLKDFLSGEISKPIVIDADGLRILGNWKDWHIRIPNESVLTPHPGEMAALTGRDVEHIQSNRLQVSERFAAEWNQIVLLKGAISIIAAPDGRTALIPISTSALATAGTGDVLAGLITGLLAQGLNPFEAACAGAWLHAKAGQNAARRIGSNASVIASDLLVEFPRLLNKKEG
jgi:NAD(P)H-hydrate epimerase